MAIMTEMFGSAEHGEAGVEAIYLAETADSVHHWSDLELAACAIVPDAYDKHLSTLTRLDSDGIRAVVIKVYSEMGVAHA